ncbi:MAG: hypothetical protein IKR25_04010 [Muribaculaceae bacterium]|nr:hypothetical protein [Muribaculaceae bacterium]
MRKVSQTIAPQSYGKFTRYGKKSEDKKTALIFGILAICKQIAIANGSVRGRVMFWRFVMGKND